MPVAVNVPIRIKVDPDGLARRPRCIEDALSKALGRALKQSSRVVLDARGGYTAIQIHAPEISWGGDGLDRVTQAHRAATSDLVASALDRAVEAAGLLAGGEGQETVAVPLADDASERLDPDRHAPIVGRYIIPSYDRPGRKVAIKTESKGKPSNGTTAAAAANAPVVDFVMVQESWDNSDYLFALENVALDYAFRADGNDEKPRLPMASPGAVGLLFAHYTGGYKLVFYDVPDPGRVLIGTDFATFSLLLNTEFTFKTPYWREVSADAGTLKVRQVERPVGLSDSYVITFVPAATETARRAFREKWIHNKLPEQLTAERDKLRPAVTDAQFAELVKQQVAEQVAAINDDPSITGFAILEPGELCIDLDFEWPTTLGSGPILILPRTYALTEEEIRRRAKAAAKGRFSPESGGTGKCPKDTVPQDKWGGFLYEPALDEIGDAGEIFGYQIAEIAADLGIDEGTYAAQFCIEAAQSLRDKADAVTDMNEIAAGENRAATAGNLGPIDFTPGESAIIATIRRYAATLVKISRLVELINQTFEHKEYECAIHGLYRGNGSGWALHFLEEVVPEINWVVYHLFVGGCRSMLIQLLVTSEIEIEKRQIAMDRYAPLFEKWILPEIVGVAELEKMQGLLSQYQLQKFTSGGVTAITGEPAQDWLLATTRLVAEISGPTTTRAPGEAYDFVVDGGVDKIRGTNGVLWSKDDLTEALRFQRTTVEGIDPLVKQITDTPDAVERFRGSSAIRDELDRLLDEMLNDNKEMQYKARSDAMFGFGASQRTEDVPNATVPYSSYRLTGIHLMTHQAIGDAFGGRRLYGRGINFLFDSEEGKASLKGAALLVGMIALSVFVPGSGAFLATGVGAVAAAHELDVAKERKRLYRALINPEQVLTYAEVEVGLFVAWFGFVLSLIPEAGKATAEFITGLKSGGRQILKQEVKLLAEYAVKDLLAAFVKETVLNMVMSEIIDKALAPFIEEVAAEASIVGAGDGGAFVDPQEREFIAMIRSEEVL